MAYAPFQIHSFSLYSQGGCFWEACTFIIVYIISCQCPTRHLAQAFGPGDPILLFRQFASRRRRFASRANIARAAAAAVGADLGAGQDFGLGACFGLLCSLRCSVCLLGLLLCARFRLSLPLLGLFIFWLKAPCFGSFVVPAGGTALPLGLGDLNNLFLLVRLGLFILSRNSVSNPFAINIDSTRQLQIAL